MKSVPLGETAQLVFTARGRNDDRPNTQCVLKIERKDDRRVIERGIDISVDEGRAVHRWKGAGLDDDELQFEARCEVWHEDQVVSEDEVRVFRRTLEVTAIDEDGQPIEGARCRLKQTLHQDVAAQWKLDPRRTVEAETDAQGIAKLEFLPGNEDFELSWRAPHELVKWSPNNGWKREATLRNTGFRATLSHPATGDSTAWVNEPEDHEDDDPYALFGPKVELQFEGKLNDDSIAADEYVYCRVSRNVGSERLDHDGPKFGKTPLPSRASLLHRIKLDADGKGKVPLHLGHGGGDVFTIEVGSTRACEDDRATITTRRHLHVELTFGTRPPDDIAALTKHVQTSLADAFIDVDIDPARYEKDSNKLSVVTQAEWQSLGLPPNDLPELSLVEEGHGGPSTKVKADGRARLAPLVFNVLYERKTKNHSVRWSGNNSRWIKFPVSLREGNWIAFPPTMPVEERATYRTMKAVRIEGHAMPVSKADWEEDAERKRFRFTLSPEVHGKRAISKAAFKLHYISPVGGSVGTRNIVLAWGPKTTLPQLGHALVHEIGHVYGVADPTKAPPGPKMNYQYAYTRHGHNGEHCRYRLPKKHYDAPNYGDLLDKKKVHGHCVMWGGVGPKFNYARAARFCPDCLRHLRAAKID